MLAPQSKTACRWEADRLLVFMEQGLQHVGEERQRLAQALVQRRQQLGDAAGG